LRIKEQETRLTLQEHDDDDDDDDFESIHLLNCGPDSSVGIVTDYGLEGPGSNPVGDEIFRPSRPALGPTQPPVK